LTKFKYLEEKNIKKFKNLLGGNIMGHLLFAILLGITLLGLVLHE